MPTRHDESTHEAEPDYALADPNTHAERPSADRLQGATGVTDAQPDAATAAPRESGPDDHRPLREDNADDVTQGDQDIDTAGTAHDDESPTKSL